MSCAKPSTRCPAIWQPDSGATDDCVMTMTTACASITAAPDPKPAKDGSVGADIRARFEREVIPLRRSFTATRFACVATTRMPTTSSRRP